MIKTQYDIIRELHKGSERHGDGFVCANDYRNFYVPYFWKRQAELRKQGITFERRPCEHGTKRGLDYKIIYGESVKISIAGTVEDGKVSFYRPDFLQAQARLKSKLL